MRAELGKERRRERVAGLAPQVDDLTDGSAPARRAAELEPLEPLPALRPRRGAAVDGHGALERRPLRRDRPRVVARVGLLLVRGVVLLVDADQAEPAHRREHGRARADRDRRLARDDPLALVAPLRLGQCRVEDSRCGRRSARGSARRLRRERDLRHEDDRAAPSLERGRARLQIDLGLAAAGRAGSRRLPPSPSRASRSARSRVAATRQRRRRLRREAGARPSAARPAVLAWAAQRARAHEPGSSRSSPRPRARARRAPGQLVETARSARRPHRAAVALRLDHHSALLRTGRSEPRRPLPARHRPAPRR